MKRLELGGQKFNEWKVISYEGKGKWKCECSCGNIREVSGSQLVSNKSKSCGHNTTGFKDMTGEVFGEWTVLEYYGKSYWKCQCTCGTIKNVSVFHLRSGRTKSCGHGLTGFSATGFKEDRDINVEKQEVKVGNIINEWEVIEHLGENTWKCRCSCGDEKVVTTWNLRSGHSKSCGHGKLIDLTDKTFGEWHVDDYKGKSRWNCTCSCGNKAVVKNTDLIAGKSKSCGHSKKILKNNLVGTKYGMLTVIEYVGSGTYLCECECGNFKEIRGANLLNEGTISCGCKHTSKYTAEYLTDLIANYTKIMDRMLFISDIQNITGLHPGYVGMLIRRYGLEKLVDRAYRSKFEREVCEYIIGLVGKEAVKVCDRTILNNQELDIYVPSLKLAIEFNGNYWHSEQHKKKDYHQKKTIACAKQGIRLIHIFEYEWTNSTCRQKLEQMIYGIATNNKTIIYARKCSVAQVEGEEESDFLNANHLQNYSASKLAYGLYCDNKLISIMTFGKPRFNSNYEWELIRYCNAPDISIVGGAEKLFSAFIEECKPQSIISYCSISKFTGGVYLKLGFKTSVSDITEPNYVWADYNSREDTLTLSRYQTQKQRLLEQGLGIYGDTEDEIMTNRGFIKIYDSGNLRFIWTESE